MKRTIKQQTAKHSDSKFETSRTSLDHSEGHISVCFNIVWYLGFNGLCFFQLCTAHLQCYRSQKPLRRNLGPPILEKSPGALGMNPTASKLSMFHVKIGCAGCHNLSEIDSVATNTSDKSEKIHHEPRSETMPLPSFVKRELHNQGKCQPCLHNTKDGCRYGDKCRNCHFCTAEQVRKRQSRQYYMERAQRRARERGQDGQAQGLEHVFLF